MPLTPGYGETLLPEDELVALLPHVIEVLDKPIRKADVYALEQAVQEQVSEELLTAAFAGSLQLPDLLSDYYFGAPRQQGTAHAVFKTPWQGDPRVNLQSDHGKAKAYQVRQVISAIDRLNGIEEGDR